MINKIIINNFIWLFFDKLFKNFGNLILNLQVIIYLSVNEYGLLNLGISSTLFITLLLNFYREIIVKEYSISDSLDNDLNLLLSSIYTRFITITTIIILVVIINPSVIIKSLILASLLNLSDIPELYWQSKGKIHKTVLIRNIIFVFSSILKLYALIVKSSLEIFLFAFILESILNSVISFLILHFDLKLKTKRVYETLQRTIFIYKQSIPLLLTGFFTLCYMRLDQYIIKWYLGDHSLGKYTFVITFVEMLQSLPFIFGTAIAPTIFQHKSQQNLLNEIRRIMSYLLIIGTLLIIILLTLFPFISNYYNIENAYGIMVILAFGTFPTFFSYIATKYLIHTNQINHFLKRSLVAFLFSTLSNIIFIKYWGLFAISINYAISQWYIGFYSNKSLSDKNLFNTQKEALKALFSATVYQELNAYIYNLVAKRK